MGYIVATLRDIRKKYKLKSKDKITLKQLEEISKSENLSMKELALLFQINNVSFSRLIHNKQKRAIISTFEAKSINNEELKKAIKIGKIRNEDLFKLSNKYGDNYVKQILCISPYNYKKILIGKKETIRVFNCKIKTRVNLLKIHLQNASGYYKESELHRICNAYSITLKQYLYYSSPTEKYYKFQRNILKNNKNGLWIGKSFGLSEEFLKENFIEVYNKCQNVAIRMAMYYGEKELVDIFRDVALEEVIKSRRKS